MLYYSYRDRELEKTIVPIPYGGILESTFMQSNGFVNLKLTANKQLVAA